MILKKASLEDFEIIYSEMQRNFIPDEIRDEFSARNIFSKNEFTVYHAIENATRVGFITVWQLSDFLFAEHFVTYENFRNKGYGAKVLDELKTNFSSIILEVEHPESEIQKRRLAFYKRQGFRENKKPYMQPSYRNGGQEVPLIIMSYPEPLSEFDDTISEIKRIVYGKI